MQDESRYIIIYLVIVVSGRGTILYSIRLFGINNCTMRTVDPSALSALHYVSIMVVEYFVSVCDKVNV